MRKIQRMSEAEKEVMQHIWDAGGSLTSARLLEYLRETGSGWKTSTVLTFVARLVDKGLLTVIKRGRSNEYFARFSESDYRRFETRVFLDTVHDGSVRSLLSALCECCESSPDESEAIRIWFDKMGKYEEQHEG